MYCNPLPNKMWRYPGLIVSEKRRHPKSLVERVFWRAWRREGVRPRATAHYRLTTRLRPRRDTTPAEACGGLASAEEGSGRGSLDRPGGIVRLPLESRSSVKVLADDERHAKPMSGKSTGGVRPVSSQFRVGVARKPKGSRDRCRPAWRPSPAPASRIRLPSHEKDATVMAPSPWMFAAPPLPQVVRAAGTAFRGRFTSTAVEDDALLRNDCCVARFGPTTPTRAGSLVDASVDPTEARRHVQDPRSRLPNRCRFDCRHSRHP
jgi:hypothetical protein